MKPGGMVARTLLGAPRSIELIAPDHLMAEVAGHAEKISDALGVQRGELLPAIEAVFRRMSRMVRASELPSTAWREAEELVRRIDPKDAAYVALALAEGAMLWTADKKLSHGLLRADVRITIDTATMRALIEHA